MGKLPWAKFFYADFVQDTHTLSNQAAGGWIRILCQMWHKNTGTLTFTKKQLSRLLGTNENTAMEIINEIIENNISNGNITEPNGKITVISRRIKREVLDRENNRLRQERFQNKKPKRKNNGSITGEKLEAKKSEAKKSENTPPIPPQENDDKKDMKAFQEIFDYWNTLHLVNHHRSIKSFIPHIRARLQVYSKEEIIESMRNYAAILQGDQYKWSFSFSLGAFLKREKNYIDHFATRNNPFSNYLIDSQRKKPDTPTARRLRESRKEKNENI